MPEAVVFQGRVPPSVALALLESLRDVDTPEGELFSDEDQPLNLRRRLGLSGVIGEQIARYSRLREGRDSLTAQEVASLFTLIARRTDSIEVFAEAGRRLVARSFGRGSRGARLGHRLLPGAVRRRRALRRIRRLATLVNPGAIVRVSRKPVRVTVERSLAVRAVEGGEGCALLGGAIESVMNGFPNGGCRIVHARCEARSDPCCEWTLEPVVHASAEAGGPSG
ncbi:MAG: hypothetical protein ACE5HQ_02640 [Gemmatimonadota bacterium]